MTSAPGRPSDPWAQQRELARTTVVWSAASIGAGAALIRRASRRTADRTTDPTGPDATWWRSFGRQHVGWGLVDLGIVGVTTVLQHRRMRAAGDPGTAGAQDRERRTLHRVLLVNTVADVGYVVVGALLARRADRRVAGAGAAIVVQGAFLAVHDGWHTVRSRARSR